MYPPWVWKSPAEFGTNPAHRERFRLAGRSSGKIAARWESTG